MYVPPPPAIVAMEPARPTPVAVQFSPGRATCAGTSVGFVHAEVPLPSIGERYAQAATGVVPAAVPVTLRFSIDARGRPHGIARLAAPSEPPQRLYVDTSDIEPSLAVSRFAAGPARTACSVTYAAAVAPLDAAPIGVLAALAAHNRMGRHGRDVVRRLMPAGSTCAFARAVRPLVLVYTDPERLRLTPGSFAWTVLNFDIDVRGNSRNVRTVASAGTATLDSEAKRALASSTFVKTPRVGCVRWYADRSPQSFAAPDRPADGLPQREDTTCPVPAARLVSFASKPAFPPQYMRRGIEGWAHVRFDVAPWGDIGNVEVVASEPAEAFGDAAKASLRHAKVKAPGKAYTGCVAPVAYRLADDESGEEPGGDLAE